MTASSKANGVVVAFYPASQESSYSLSNVTDDHLCRDASFIFEDNPHYTASVLSGRTWVTSRWQTSFHQQQVSNPQSNHESLIDDVIRVGGRIHKSWCSTSSWCKDWSRMKLPLPTLELISSVPSWSKEDVQQIKYTDVFSFVWAVELIPRGRWLLGRCMKVFPGRVRTAIVHRQRNLFVHVHLVHMLSCQ